MWDVDFGFPAGAIEWGSAAGTDAALATSIGGGNAVSLGIFGKKYEGNVPSMAQLDSYIDEGRIHINRNPYGNKEFFVLYSEAPAWSNTGTNGCWDHDTSTVCEGVSGADYPAARVDLTTGGAVAGITRITDLVENNSTGAYYVVPYFNYGGFSRLVSFIKVADGRRFLDELLRERALVIITDASTQCGGSLPAPGVGTCENGNVFNVLLDWSTCNGPGSTCPSSSVLSNVKVQNGSGASKVINIASDYKQNWTEWFNGSTWKGGHSLLTQYTSNGSNKIRVTINGSDQITAVDTGTAVAASSKYNIGMNMSCSGGECNTNGFYLVDENGAVYKNVGATSKWANNSICEVGVSNNNCTTGADVVKYVDDIGGTLTLGNYELNSYNLDFDADANGGQSGVQNFGSAVRQYKIYNGPVLNPNFKCSFEPFYVDKNNNGQLDCSADDTASVTDVSFSNEWDYGYWVNDPAAASENRSSYQLMSAENGYAFDDPVGTKKLLTTAFSGWFDGAHSISSTTNLNSLQAFALVFLFFTEGNDGQRYIDGLSGLPLGATGKFNVESPQFMSNGSELAPINQTIGGAFNNFHQ